MIHLWHKGTIYTGNGQFAESFAVIDGRFLAVGALDHVRRICHEMCLTNLDEAQNHDASEYGLPQHDRSECSLPQRGLQEHDLQGRFVCAGFHDSHMHLLSLGKSLVEVNLAGHTSSKKEMITHLKKEFQERQNALREARSAHYHTDKMPSETSSIRWFCGRGWNQEYFQDGHVLPTRWDLDQVSVDIPIYLARACGHMAVVNSKAIQLMGLTTATPQSADASFDVDEQGQPTGILRENALSWATALIPAPTKEEIKTMLTKACDLCNQYGITSVQSDDFDMWPEVSPQMILDCFEELIREDTLTVRVNEQCLLPTMQKLDNFLALGYRTGSCLSGCCVSESCLSGCSHPDSTPTDDSHDRSIPTDRFRIGPLKLLLDGSLGANTAYLQGEYADAPGEKGMPLYTQEDLNAMVLRAHESGMQIAMHAIGDGAVQMGIDAYRHAQKICPRNDARHGIVHCQLTTAEQLEAFRELGLHAYIQSIFLDADAPIVEKRVSHPLAATSYQAATYLRKGISMSNGSDAPVELPDVMAGIQCAVTRRSLHTAMDAPYLPGEAMSVAQAIDSFTAGGAYASFEENRKGRIAPGMLADFVVLEQDPLQVKADSLAQIQVCATILGGHMVYSSPFLH